jgi:peptide methionine sulfoxide reductase MsrB
VWENMRVLENGESVSVDGTHLGHNLPDRGGNRYCINLVCVAGEPVEVQEPSEEAEAEGGAAGL